MTVRFAETTTLPLFDAGSPGSPAKMNRLWLQDSDANPNRLPGLDGAGITYTANEVATFRAEIEMLLIARGLAIAV
jgi:hypothetical protein